MRAHFPRAYLDVNREPYELDPALFGGGRLPDYANTHSVRVIGGLGTIARVVNEQEEIYRAPLSVEAALERIERLHAPITVRSRSLIEDTRAPLRLRVSRSTVIPCPRIWATGTAFRTADIILGDRYRQVVFQGARSACRRHIDSARATVWGSTSPTRAASSPSITVVPTAAFTRLQIEVNRRLYMNEETFEKLPGFETSVGRPAPLRR